MPSKNASETDSIDIEIDDSVSSHPSSVSSQRSPAAVAAARASQRLANTSTRRASNRTATSSGSTRSPMPAAASSRRATAPSARAPVSKRVPLGPSTSMPWKKILKGFFLIVVLPAALIVGIVLLTRPDETNQRGSVAAEEGTRQLTLARESLAASRLPDAYKAIAAGRVAVNVPAPTDPRLADRLATMRRQFEELQMEAQKRDQDIKARDHHHDLAIRFARLSEMENADLDSFEKQCLAFLTNPVAPGAEADPAAVTAYPALIGDAQRMRDSIEPARKKLAEQFIAKQGAAARVEITELLQQERFQAALDVIATYRQKYPQCHLEEHQALVDKAASHTWEAAKVYIDNRIQDGRSPGLPADRRKQANAEARKRLQDVIERFGIPEQVEAAKGLLQQIPAE